MDRKALAIAIAALMLVFLTSQGASASKITKLDLGSKPSSQKVHHKDLNVSWKDYDKDHGKKKDHKVEKAQKAKKDHKVWKLTKYDWSKSWKHWDRKGSDESPIPEPSSALVLGLGLFVASRFARRSR